MEVWDKTGGTNGGEFGAFTYIFCGEGKIETTIRAGEGPEMSEDISESKAGMSCTKPGESDFQVSGGLV